MADIITNFGTFVGSFNFLNFGLLLVYLMLAYITASMFTEGSKDKFLLFSTYAVFGGLTFFANDIMSAWYIYSLVLIFALGGFMFIKKISSS